MSSNSSPEAIQLLKENPDKINWFNLSSNECVEAIQLLKENPDKINFDELSWNKCAGQLLKKNPYKINWRNLVYNQCVEVFQLLKENPDKINWYEFSKNNYIFAYDYDKMRENCLLFKEDLMKNRFHPINLYKFSSWGFNGGIDEENNE